MAERPNQNYEQRDILSLGPKFRIDTNNPQMGERGTNVFLQYAVTDDNSRQFSALDESGSFRVHNEKDIEIVSGRKLKGDVGIQIATLKGSIEITCEGDGNILIKGSNIENKDIYSLESNGTYFYSKGWHLKSLYSIFIGFIFASSTIWNVSLNFIQSFAWIIGAIVAFIIYYLLASK